MPRFGRQVELVVKDAEVTRYSRKLYSSSSRLLNRCMSDMFSHIRRPQWEQSTDLWRCNYVTWLIYICDMTLSLSYFLSRSPSPSLSFSFSFSLSLSLSLRGFLSLSFSLFFYFSLAISVSLLFPLSLSLSFSLALFLVRYQLLLKQQWRIQTIPVIVSSSSIRIEQ